MQSDSNIIVKGAYPSISCILQTIFKATFPDVSNDIKFSDAIKSLRKNIGNDTVRLAILQLIEQMSSTMKTIKSSSSKSDEEETKIDISITIIIDIIAILNNWALEYENIDKSIFRDLKFARDWAIMVRDLTSSRPEAEVFEKKANLQRDSAKESWATKAGKISDKDLKSVEVRGKIVKKVDSDGFIQKKKAKSLKVIESCTLQEYRDDEEWNEKICGMRIVVMDGIHNGETGTFLNWARALGYIHFDYETNPKKNIGLNKGRIVGILKNQYRDRQDDDENEDEND